MLSEVFFSEAQNLQTLVKKPKEITNKQEDKQNNKHIDTSFQLSGGYCCGVVFFFFRFLYTSNKNFARTTNEGSKTNNRRLFSTQKKRCRGFVHYHTKGLYATRTVK